MPDVGVLSLQIKSDASQAAGDLGQLADALSRVQTAVGKGFSLAGIAGPINKFAKSVADSSKTVSGIGTFLNAVTSYSKAFKEMSGVAFNDEPIKKLKAAIGDGIKIGQAGTQINKLREALGGEWNTANAEQASAALKTIAEGAKAMQGTGIATTAKGISLMAKALDEYATAAGKVKSVVGEKAWSGSNVSIKPVGTLDGFASSKGQMKLNLQQFGEKTPTSEVNWRDQLAGIKEASDAASGTDAQIKNMASAMKELSKATGGANLKEFADGLKAIASASEKGANSYLTLGRLATSIEKLKTAVQGFKLPDFSRLESLARTLSDNFNAENGLKRMAEGMEAIKAASQGFKMPSTKEMEKISAALSTTGGAGTGSNATPMWTAGASATETAAGFEKVESVVQSVNTELNDTVKTASELPAAVQGMNLNEVFDPSKLPIGMLGQKLDGSVQDMSQYGNAIQETSEIVEHMNPGNLPAVAGAYETIEQLCRRIADEKERANVAEQESIRLAEQEAIQRMKLAKEAMDQQRAAQKAAMSSTTEGYGTGSIRELYASTTGFGPALRGELGGKEKYAAISAVSEGTGLSKGEIIRQIVELGDEARKAKQQVNELTDSLNKPVDMGNMSLGVDRMLGIGAKAKSGEQSGSAFTSVPAAQQIQALMDRLNQPIDWKWLSQGIDQMNGIGQATLNAEQYFARFLELSQGNNQTAANLREANPELVKFNQELKDAGIEAKDFNSKLVDVDGELKQKKPDAEEAASAFSRFKDAVNNVKKAIKGSWLGKLGKQFASIAKRMAIRAIIKQITSAFKEGTENVYHYSEAIGSSLAPAMDQTASLLKQMKNSIGAAIAPAIQAVLPYINQLVNAFIDAINWVNQFFALLNGQTTWTKALAVDAKAFEDQEKSAKGASNAVKDMLADWDELNIIQQQGGSGGSGSGNKTEDYTTMFAESNQFGKDVKDIVAWIQEHLDMIKGIAEAIGITILAWKLSDTFLGGLGTMGDLVKGGLIVALGLQLTWTGAYAAGRSGQFDTASFLTAAGGALTAAVGGAIVGFKVGGATGAMIGGAAGFILSLAVGFKAFMKGDADEYARQSFARAGVNNPAGSIDPDAYIKALQAELDSRTANATLILSVYMDVPNLQQKFSQTTLQMKSLESFVVGTDAITEEDAEAFKKAWKTIMETLDEMNGKTYGTLLQGLNDALAKAVGDAKAQLVELRKEFVKITKELDEDDAKLYTEMEDILERLTENKYANETAKQADLQRYSQLSRYFTGIDTNQRFADLNQAIQDGALLDFSKEEDPVQAAKDYISKVKESIDKTKATIDEAEEALRSSHAYQVGRLESKKTAGLINETQFNEQKAVLDQVLEEDLKPLEQAKKDAEEMVNDAYEIILKTALAGDTGKAGYWETVINPLLAAVQEAGYKLPDEMRKEFGAAIEKNYGSLKSGALTGDEIADMLVGGQSADQIAKDINNALINKIKSGNVKGEKSFQWTMFDFSKNTMLGESVYDRMLETRQKLELKSLEGKNADYQREVAELVRNTFPDNETFANEILEKIGYDFSLDDVPLPGLDNANLSQSVEEAQRLLDDLRGSFQQLNGIQVQMNAGGGVAHMPLLSLQTITPHASGGFVRSGDLILANENGNFEMMGKMGNQPVVANNQQIVSGISQGVAQANSGVESRLTTIETLLNRILQKEFVARAVPGSDWGNHNAKSAEAYGRVTG